MASCAGLLFPVNGGYRGIRKKKPIPDQQESVDYTRMAERVEFAPSQVSALSCRPHNGDYHAGAYEHA